MRIPRFFLPEPLGVGASIDLSANAFNHAVRVLRLQPGAALVLFNGKGGEYRAVLEQVSRRSAQARIERFDPITIESPLNVTLAQCIAKGDRMDYTLQKATELGVSMVQPLLSTRSVVNLQGERLPKRLAHWQGILTAACEQCGRNDLPLVLQPRPLAAWLSTVATTTRLVLNPQAQQSLRDMPLAQGQVALLIGPEGGLTDDEIAQAQAAGFIGVRLGPRILRTETAAVVALAVVQTLWGDLA